MTSPLPLCAVTRSTVLALTMVGLARRPMPRRSCRRRPSRWPGRRRPCRPRQSASPQSKTGFHWEDHPTLVLGENTRIAFRARFGFVDRTSDAPLPDDEDRTLDLARKRIGVEGVIVGLFGFQVERELEEDDPWRDVYVNYQQFDAVQVMGGKFKLPFSLEENTSSTNLDFAYRSLAATYLAPGRDIGVMVHGRVVNRIIRYEVGIFEHDGQNARARNPERVCG